MTVLCSPFGPKLQQVLSTGLPAVGNKLFFYVAGSVNTKQNTYTSSTGLSANTNPIILNSLGEPTNEIWFTAGQTYKVVYAPSTDTDPPTSPIWTIDNLSGINDTTVTQDQWISSGIAPTYVSTTSFTMAGDQTANFTIGRRLKFTVTAGTVYGTILTSVFGAVTTVTMTMDTAQVLDAGLSAVSYGILSAAISSIPEIISAGTGISVTYTSGKPTIAGTPTKNYIVNGSFAVNQDVTPTTTDNSYPFDGWRLLLGAATAATIAQDTADVPTGAGFAAKLTVGAAPNNKFGIFCPIENKDMLDLRSGTCSIRVPLKATAGLTDGTGKIRIGILQWSGTADAISATPISAWGAEGTNPTLIAGWTYANTPAAISVTTAWADYTVAGVSIAAASTNIGVFIWSDDKANTTATDVLRVGGYVTLGAGSAAPAAIVAPFDAELRKCQRYFWKTFPMATAPVQNGGTNGALSAYQINGATLNVSITPVRYPVVMRISPTLTSFNPAAANAQMRWSGGGDDSATAFTAGSNDAGFEVFATTNGGSASGNGHTVHVTANSRL